MFARVLELPAAEYPLFGIDLLVDIGHTQAVTMNLKLGSSPCRPTTALSAVPLALVLMLDSQLHAQTVLSATDAVNEALTKNLNLAAEKWNVSIMEAKRITAGLRPNPVLTVSGQTLNVFGADYSANSPLGPNAVVIHTDVPFERGHKREDRIAVAQADQSVAELGIRETMRQVIFSVQSAFVDVQQSKENLKLALDNQRRFNELVSINEIRLKNGDLAQVELDRSRVAASQAATTVQQVQLQLDQSKTSLRLLLGRNEAVGDLEVAADLRRDVLLETEADFRSLAISQRPDVLLAFRQEARTTADLRLQLANGKIDYVVGTEYVRQSAFGISGGSVGVSFSAPLPLFNRNQGEIARARREQSQADAKVAALRATVGAEVEKAYRQYIVSRQMLESIEGDMLERAKSVRDTTEYSYKRGEASLIELLDAQRAFSDAMQTYNDARASYARSLYQLDAVSGASVSAAS